MMRFILVTFAFLGWAFYELSGGSDFQPASARLTDLKADPLKPVVQADASQPERSVRQAPAAKVTPVALRLASVDEVLEPRRTPQAPAATPQARIEPAVLAEPEIILPSLIANTAPATPQVVSSSRRADIRYVSGGRVNVRGGPGKGFDVVGRLTRGTEVEILEDAGNGWVRLQTLDGAAQGWMADFLLTSDG